KLNSLDERVRAVTCDAADEALLAAAGLAAASLDRVLMNPPFRDAGRQNVSPNARRRLAHVAAPDLLARWIASAAFLLKPGGVLTLIYRADGIDDVLAALNPAFGAVTILPVLPRPAKPAIRVLVRAVKGAPQGRADHAPLALNDAPNRPAAAAEAVLRGGATLS